MIILMTHYWWSGYENDIEDIEEMEDMKIIILMTQHW